jgi:hypothetical protein
MVNVDNAVCPENKTAFENISLSRTATVCHVDEMNSDLLIVKRYSSDIHVLLYNAG